MDVIVASSQAADSVAYTGTAGSTDAAWDRSPAMLVWTTTDAYVVVGEGVTATTSHTPIPAYTPVLLKVPVGSGGRVRASAIQISAGGTLYAKPCGGDDV